MPGDQQAVLKEAIDNVELLPMESQDMQCYPELQKMIMTIKSATTPREVEEVNSAVSRQRVLLGQLLSAMKSASKDITNLATSRKRKLDKMKEESIAKRKAADKQGEQEREAAEKRRMAKIKKNDSLQRRQQGVRARQGSFGPVLLFLGQACGVAQGSVACSGC